MKRITTISLVVAALVGLVACGTSPEYVAEPEVAASPAPATAPDDAPERVKRLDVGTPPCGMSTPAVRAQARRSRYGGVEGFDTRTCPPAGADRY